MSLKAALVDGGHDSVRGTVINDELLAGQHNGPQTLNEPTIDFTSVVNTAKRLVSEAMIILSKIIGPTATFEEPDSGAWALFTQHCKGHHNDILLRFILERHRECSLSLSLQQLASYS